MSTANEPAYPTPDSGGHWTNPETGYTGYQNPGQPGMTKREVIAMHAMSGLLANPTLVECMSRASQGDPLRTAQGFSAMAVRNADALLAELERTEKP